MVTQITWSCPTATCKYVKCQTCLPPANEGGGGVHRVEGVCIQRGWADPPPLEGAVRILLECILVEGLLWSELHVSRELSHDPSLEWNDVNVIKILKTTYKARN